MSNFMEDDDLVVMEQDPRDPKRLTRIRRMRDHARAHSPRFAQRNPRAFALRNTRYRRGSGPDVNPAAFSDAQRNRRRTLGRTLDTIMGEDLRDCGVVAGGKLYFLDA